jgi:Rnl2 family RNA ligase
LFDELSDSNGGLWKYNPFSGEINSCSGLTVYGELCGGYYPPFLSITNHLVQKEILYSPNVLFYAFDVAVHFNDQIRFMHYDHAMFVLNKWNFFTALPIFAGSFNDCLDFPIIFNTTIPSRLGLESIQSNEAEGVVIRPVRELSVSKKGGRALLKKKNLKFIEDVKSGKDASLEQRICSALNKNRLLSVLSKEGYSLSMGRLSFLMIQDALIDLEIQHISADLEASLREKVAEIIKESGLINSM